MVRQVKRVETYELSRHDLADDLGIRCNKVVEVTIIQPDAPLDDPIIRLTVEVSEKEELT